MKRLLLLFPILTILFAILWIAGLTLGIQMFPSELLSSESGEGSIYQLLLISALNAGIIMIYLYHTNQSGIRSMLALFIIHFGLQYFMAQIESLWFNDALKMEENSIYAILAGGAVSALLFAVLSVFIFRKVSMKKPQYQLNIDENHVSWNSTWIIKTLVMMLVIWPAVYFIAGYYIAWQFEAVRIFYSGSAEMESFGRMMQLNFAEHLYSFQIIRGLFWVLLGTLILNTTNGSLQLKTVLTGALFMILSSSQLLLDNPIMPEAVRMAHLLETSTSNFIWGVIIGITYMVKTSSKMMLHSTQ